jgi:hypothetical protein
MGKDLIGYASEKNSYIREDLASNWPIFKKRLEDIIVDSKGRAVANVHLLFGEHKNKGVDSHKGGHPPTKKYKYSKNFFRT